MPFDPSPDARSDGAAGKPSWRGALRRRRRRLLRSSFALRAASAVAHRLLRLVAAAQHRLPECAGAERRIRENHPAIVACWHGQHLLAPFFRPKDLPFVALLSKSADAEVNARVVEEFGIRTIRGSGGRDAGRTEKGGARALIALRREIANGAGAFMIADISKATAREAGLGIVTLAKITGRPILPAAAATSRRHVLARTWDKTTIPYPFGRMAAVAGEPIFVPRDASPAVLEAKRREVTRAIEAASVEAAALVAGSVR